MRSATRGLWAALLWVLSASFVAASESSPVIKTFAGGGFGDGGPATGALVSTGGLAFLGDGSLLVGDHAANRVRRISGESIVRFAGSGYAGSADGQRESAEFNSPSGVAVDPQGSVFVADTANHLIRKVDPQGTVTTMAGTGVPGFFGDGGASSEAMLNQPRDLAVDSTGNLYISDSGNNRVRRISTSGIIDTFAGNGSPVAEGDGGQAKLASLWNPTGITFDGSGNLLIADTGHHRVRKVTRDGTMTTIAGTGSAGFSGENIPARLARLSSPEDVAVGSDGTIYVADSGNQTLRRISSSGVIRTIGPRSPINVLSISFSAGLTGGNGTEVFAIDLVSGGRTRIAGQSIRITGDGGDAVEATLSYPVGLAFDRGGNLYFADHGNDRIRKIDANGVITTVAGGGSGALGDDGLATAATLKDPEWVATGPAGDLYIADSGHHRIRRVDSNGVITTVAGNGEPGFWGDGNLAIRAGLRYPSALTFDSAGNLYVADELNHRVRRIDSAGRISTVAGRAAPCLEPTYRWPLYLCHWQVANNEGAATSVRLFRPSGLAVADDGSLLIADTGHHRVLKLTDDSLTPIAGTGYLGPYGDGGDARLAGLYNPKGLALDDSGRLFIADTGNNRIRMVDLSGTISTVAGGGLLEMGDGGAPTSARLLAPSAVSPRNGRLFISDSGQHRIRVLEGDFS